MANKRKPNAVHKLNGTHREDRHGSVRDIEYKSACPVAPDYLCDVALAEWSRITPKLHEIGLVTDLDRMLLAQYCSLTAKFEEVERFNRGLHDGDEEKKELSAAWHNQYKLIQQELGITPCSRAGLKLPEAKKKDKGGLFASSM